MQFCKALGLIILFLPQIELYKKTKAHIIHTLGQDQVLLLSGKSWRIGEEIPFPVKIIHYCAPDSMQRDCLWEQMRSKWKAFRSISWMFLRAQEENSVLVSLLSHSSREPLGPPQDTHKARLSLLNPEILIFISLYNGRNIKITSNNTAFIFLMPVHVLNE